MLTDSLLRVAGFTRESIVDGKGLRLTIFCQGCPHGCPGCHNPETHDINGGRMIKTSEVLEMALSNPLLDGITLSGGEPMLQPEPLTELCRAAVKNGLNIWIYTGYTLEELLEENNAGRLGLLALADVVVDGRFILSQRTLDMPFAGSRNQRILNAKKSLSEGRAVPAEF